jgi:hypothetical protein
MTRKIGSREWIFRREAVCMTAFRFLRALQTETEQDRGGLWELTAGIQKYRMTNSMKMVTSYCKRTVAEHDEIIYTFTLRVYGPKRLNILYCSNISYVLSYGCNVIGYDTQKDNHTDIWCTTFIYTTKLIIDNWSLVQLHTFCYCLPTVVMLGRKQLKSQFLSFF